MPGPLIAVEEPPDRPGAGRSRRYIVIDASRNRTAGIIRWVELHPRMPPHWLWIINIPQEGVQQQPSPEGRAETLAGALQAFRAAWDTYPARDDWPPIGALCWLDAERYGLPLPGMGPWQPGREPRGWRPAPTSKK